MITYEEAKNKLPKRKAWETKKGYFQVPNEIWDSCDDLKLVERSTLLMMSRLSDEDNKCFPSYQTIARKLNISRTSAIRAISGLEEKEYIYKFYRYEEKYGKKYNKSNLYVINFDKISNSNEEDYNEEDFEVLYDDTEEVKSEEVIEVAKPKSKKKKNSNKGKNLSKKEMRDMLESAKVTDEVKQEELIERFFKVLTLKKINNQKSYFQAMIINYKKEEYNKPNNNNTKTKIKTRFHNFEQRTDKYTNEELMDIWVGDSLNRKDKKDRNDIRLKLEELKKGRKKA